MKQTTIGTLISFWETVIAYYPLATGGWWPGESEPRQVFPIPCTVSQLKVELSVAPGSNKSRIFTLLVNGSLSALTCTISGTNKYGEDLLHEVEIEAGDKVAMKNEPIGSPAKSSARTIALIETGSLVNSVLLGRVIWYNRSITLYWPVSGFAPDGMGNTPQDVRRVVPRNGTLKYLYIHSNNAPGTNKWKATLYKNNLPTSLSCQIEGEQTSACDAIHEVDVVAGDVICIETTPGEYQIYGSWGSAGLVFISSNGESLVLSGSNDDLATTGTEYHQIYSPSNASEWSSNEAIVKQGVHKGKIKNLRILLTAAPGSGNSHIFTVRKNSADSDLKVIISNSNIEGMDNIHSVVFDDWDYIAIKHTVSGVPVTADTCWSAVLCGIELSIPVARTDPATNIELDSSTLNGYLLDDGGMPCDCSFEWGLTISYGNETTKQEKSSPESFLDDISNLSPATTYHFRAKATHSLGDGYGADAEFCTLGGYSYWM